MADASTTRHGQDQAELAHRRPPAVVDSVLRGDLERASGRDGRATKAARAKIPVVRRVE